MPLCKPCPHCTSHHPMPSGRRLPSLLRMGYSSQAVGALYSQLATACLNSIRANSADLVLERAEDAGLQVSS